jgi:D-aminopeptidase
VLQGLRDKTAQLLRNRDDWQMNLLMLDPPFTLRIAFTHTLACDVVSTSPLYHRIDGRTVEVTMDSFAQVFQMLQAAYTMLAYTNYMDAGGF